MKNLLLIIIFLQAILLYKTVEAADTCAIKRDKNGRIVRSSKAVSDFKKQNVCPGTGKIEKSCKGYIIDHVVPLACCGKDAPSNMQWQTLAESKEKDKWERKQCGTAD